MKVPGTNILAEVKKNDAPLPSFLVVIPTVRFHEETVRTVVSRNQQRLTHSTHFLVLDGVKGKAQTLNAVLEALQQAKPAWRPKIFVTIDDDYIPPERWQYLVANAIEKIPQVGILSFDLTELGGIGLEYMMGQPARQSIHGVECLAPQLDRMPGCFFAMCTELALAIGPTPILGGTKYQVYEDVWRCRRATKVGGINLYLPSANPPELVPVPESPEYSAMKRTDIDLYELSGVDFLRKAEASK